MILADVLSGLVEMDTDLLLAINGWRAEWADLFMYAFSGKWIWIPLYASILYVIARNLHWKVAIGCAVAIALTIIFADQIGATLIRPWVCRLRPANPENPISEFVHIVNGYRGGRYGFPSCHAANSQYIRTCFLFVLSVPQSCFELVYYGMGAADVLFPFLFGSALSRRLIGGRFYRFCRCVSLLPAFLRGVQVSAERKLYAYLSPDLGGRHYYDKHLPL